MAEAERDENRVPTLIGVDKDDANVPTKIAVNPATGAIIVELG